jgi:hypothetical protein
MAKIYNFNNDKEELIIKKKMKGALRKYNNEEENGYELNDYLLSQMNRYIDTLNSEQLDKIINPKKKESRFKRIMNLIRR